MTPETQKFDVENFARIVLFHLASLRCEMMQTQMKVIEILEHQMGKTDADYKKLVKDQIAEKEEERQRIYLATLGFVNLGPHELPPLTGDPNLN